MAVRPSELDTWVQCEDLRFTVTDEGVTMPVAGARSVVRGATGAAEAAEAAEGAGAYSASFAVSWRDLDAFLDEVVVRLLAGDAGESTSGC